MDLNSLITKLNIMSKESPEEYTIFLNRLKIERPGVYEKIKGVVPQPKQGVVSFEDTPLDLKIAQDKERKYTVNIILIVLVIILIFLGAIFFLSQ